jgi:undecaprenyl-diphosphatase
VNPGPGRFGQWTLVALLLVAFAAILGCAIAAGQLLALVERHDGSTAFDSSITSWVVAHRGQGLTTLARALSRVGSQVVLTPVAVIAGALLLAKRRFVLAGLVVAGWGGAILLYTFTKAVVHRPRPPMEIWLTNVGKSTSFPSGHATQSLATFLALAFVGAAWLSKPRSPGAVVAVVLAAGVGWSRVYLGVHWTTDVLAGWLIAAAWIAAVTWLAARARRQYEPAEELAPVGAEPADEYGA